MHPYVLFVYMGNHATPIGIYNSSYHIKYRVLRNCNTHSVHKALHSSALATKTASQCIQIHALPKQLLPHTDAKRYHISYAQSVLSLLDCKLQEQHYVRQYHSRSMYESYAGASTQVSVLHPSLQNCCSNNSNHSQKLAQHYPPHTPNHS